MIVSIVLAINSANDLIDMSDPVYTFMNERILPLLSVGALSPIAVQFSNANTSHQGPQ